MADDQLRFFREGDGAIFVESPLTVIKGVGRIGCFGTNQHETIPMMHRGTVRFEDDGRFLTCETDVSPANYSHRGCCFGGHQFDRARHASLIIAESQVMRADWTLVGYTNRTACQLEMVLAITRRP